MIKDDIEKPRWWAQAIMIGSVIGAVLLVMGGFGTRLGMWSYSGGFTVASGGVLLAAAGFFLGVIGFIVALRKGLKAERSNLLIALVLCTILLVQVGMQMNAVSSVPAIHNISTDTQDPPAFDALVAVREAEGANPLAYDASVLAGQQQQAYPWVQTLKVPTNPGIVLNKQSPCWRIWAWRWSTCLWSRGSPRQQTQRFGLGLRTMLSSESAKTLKLSLIHI